jgi:hypothetical protein
MKYKKLLLFLLVLLPSCKQCSNEDVETLASAHKEKLRKHFIQGDTSVDISTLISETRSISARLKRAGMMKKANKFDSYTDVLMFGNRTIDESLNDVMKLAKHRESEDECSSVCDIVNNLFH